MTPDESQRPTPEAWEKAFGTLPDDERTLESHARGPRGLLPLVVLVGAASAGFLFHVMGRYFWIPVVPALAFGIVGAVGALLVCDTREGAGVARMALIALLVALFSYGTVHVWNALEFYFWGGAQRLYNLEMARDVESIRPRPPIAGPRELLRERVGRSDLMGYYIYEGRAGRVLMYSRRYSRYSGTPRIRRISGEMYWLEVALEFFGAGVVAVAAARKLAAW